MTSQAMVKLADELELAKTSWLPMGGHVVEYALSLDERDLAIAALRLAAAPAASGGVRVGDDKVRRGIYIASKTKHAARWIALRASGTPIISTWIDEAGEGQSADLNDLWVRCIRESSSCKVLIAYREPDEMLKGGWVEIGAALQARVPVYAVGLEQYTIAKYHGIQHFQNIESAFAAALTAPPLPADGVRERLRSVLKEHWITSVNCDKQESMNRASCSCSLLVGHRVPSVGAAVDEWIEHVLATLASPHEQVR